MKAIKFITLSFVTAIVFTGCAVVKVPQATGGSKSDGVIEMSFDYGLFEKPQVDWNQALVTAKHRCEAWGYQEAEAFGGATNKCEAYNAYGNCVHVLVTMKYQCTGSN